MFALLVTIISIALVTALILATMYYGNGLNGQSGAQAQSAKYFSEGNQLVGAVELYKSDNDGQLPAGTADEIKQALIDKNYLKAWPSSDWAFTTDYALRGGVEESACIAINKKMNVTGIPSCTDSAYLSTSICCQDATTTGS